MTRRPFLQVSVSTLYCGLNFLCRDAGGYVRTKFVSDHKPIVVDEMRKHKFDTKIIEGVYIALPIPTLAFYAIYN